MRSTKVTYLAACANAILAGQLYPDTQVVSLVTKNIGDFGVRKLASLGIEVQRPDTFLLELFRQDPTGAASAFTALRRLLAAGFVRSVGHLPLS
jgi:hypothetical protein